MKKFLAIIMSACVTVTALVGTGCRGTQGSNSPDGLDVYCYLAGYGDEYLTNSEKTGVLDIFQQQEWVKEEYPNLTVTYSSNSNADEGIQKLANQRANTYDVIFTGWLEEISTNLVTNLTDAVYLTKIPGKPGTKIMDILPDYVKDSIRRTDVEARTDGYENYFAARYLLGFFGFMYNKKVLEHYELEVPVTTKEFIDACKTVKNSFGTPSAYKFTVGGKTQEINASLMMSSKSSYIQWMFPAYWTQYEGMEEYTKFFEGVTDLGDEGEYTTDNFKQKGRLRSFQTMEDLIRENCRWKDVSSASHTAAQNQFLLGNGLFHWNGDYFTPEMAKDRKENLDTYGVQADIGMMALPVMSDIVEKLSFYEEEKDNFVEAEKDGKVYLTSNEKPYRMLDAAKQEYYDNILAAIIREIDKGTPYTEGYEVNGCAVTQKDWNIIKNARNIKGNYTVFPYSAVIPSDSPAKALAADFLRFMYSDVAIEAFSKASKGMIFPIDYYSTLGDAKYGAMVDGFEQETKDKFNLIKQGATLIPSEASFRLGKVKNGLKSTIYGGNMGLNMILDEKEGYKTPEAFFIDDIEFYNSDGKSNWNSLLDSIRQ